MGTPKEVVEKKAKAEKLLKIAVEAEKYAAEVVADAKRVRQDAEAALADAEDKVLVSVPNSFSLNFGPDKDGKATPIVHIVKGTDRLPREHAEHPYAKANGVKVLGLPVAEEKKADEKAAA